MAAVLPHSPAVSAQKHPESHHSLWSSEIQQCTRPTANICSIGLGRLMVPTSKDEEREGFSEGLLRILEKVQMSELLVRSRDDLPFRTVSPSGYARNASIAVNANL